MAPDPRLTTLHDRIAAVAPIVGLSVPDWSDKATWQVWYEGGDAVQASNDPIVGPVVATFDVNATPVSVPQTVTPRQARLALLAAGLLDQVEAAVNAAGGATKVSWDYATQINRDDPLITQIGSSLSLTSDQIDTLFKYAATQ